MINSQTEIAAKETKAIRNVNRLKGYIKNEGRLLSDNEQKEFDNNISVLNQCKKDKTELAKKIKADIEKKDNQVKEAS